jgi:hypothetical protein
MWFLIEYDRPSGTLVRFEQFQESERTLAQQARLSLEIDLNRQRVNHEIVILQAKDEAAVRKTHRRYFESLDQLASKLAYLSVISDNPESFGEKPI